jgi:transcriptional regulator of nitric oxide reductase
MMIDHIPASVFQGLRLHELQDIERALCTTVMVKTDELKEHAKKFFDMWVIGEDNLDKATKNLQMMTSQIEEWSNEIKRMSILANKFARVVEHRLDDQDEQQKQLREDDDGEWELSPMDTPEPLEDA